LVNSTSATGHQYITLSGRLLSQVSRESQIIGSSVSGTHDGNAPGLEELSFSAAEQHWRRFPTEPLLQTLGIIGIGTGHHPQAGTLPFLQS
jgi:hypothetical protein